MTGFLLLASIMSLAVLPQDRPTPGSESCDRIVRQMLAELAARHWNPGIRADTSASAERALRACADGADVETGARRALARFDDPAIRFFDMSHFERTLQEWNGEVRVGIGLAEVLSIDVDEATRRLTVIAPVPDSPAEAAGLRARDVVTEIDGLPTDSMGLTHSMKRLRIEAGNAVRLTVFRDDRRREIVLTAEELPSLDALDVQRRQRGELEVLSLRLRQFTPGVAAELRAAVESATDVDAVILDLRGNPGGRIDEMVAAAGVFLPGGLELAHLSGPNPTTLVSEGPPVAPDIPISVLIGPGTASAAEVLAAALAANAGALMYGQRSFGKGLAHRAVPVEEDRWVLMLPIAQVELPGGTRLLGNGVDPDVRTANPIEQALRALQQP